MQPALLAPVIREPPPDGFGSGASVPRPMDYPISPTRHLNTAVGQCQVLPSPGGLSSCHPASDNRAPGDFG